VGKKKNGQKLANEKVVGEKEGRETKIAANKTREVVVEDEVMKGGDLFLRGGPTRAVAVKKVAFGYHNTAQTIYQAGKKGKRGKGVKLPLPRVLPCEDTLLQRTVVKEGDYFIPRKKTSRFGRNSGARENEKPHWEQKRGVQRGSVYRCQIGTLQRSGAKTLVKRVYHNWPGKSAIRTHENRASDEIKSDKKGNN